MLEGTLEEMTLAETQTHLPVATMLVVGTRAVTPTRSLAETTLAETMLVEMPTHLLVETTPVGMLAETTQLETLVPKVETQGLTQVQRAVEKRPPESLPQSLL